MLACSGWHTADNIILAQDVIYSMRRKKGWHSLVAVKIDLEKAYD